GSRHTSLSRDWSSDLCSSDLRRRVDRWTRADRAEPVPGVAVDADRRRRALCAARAPRPRHLYPRVLLVVPLAADPAAARRGAAQIRRATRTGRRVDACGLDLL